MKRLYSISVFYRNNLSNGIGFTLTEEVGDLERVLDTLSEHYEQMYREAVQQSELQLLIRDLFTQLDQLGQKRRGRKSLPLRDLLIVMGNVLLLEKYGFIRSDEFNGMQYCYVDDER